MSLKDYEPPAGLVPQLHCVRYRKLASAHPIDASLGSAQSVAQWVEETGLVAIAEARSALHEHLTSCLFGDRLAAEYLLLHLVSRVYRRASELNPLGCLPLNLVGLPPVVNSVPVASHFGSFMSELVPAVHTIPLSRETLQTTQLTPVKDYDHERLISGQLQLAAGTQLIVDETALTEGQLEQKCAC